MAHASTITLDRASLTALFLEALLYGAFVILYILAMWAVYLKSRQEKKINYPLPVVSSTMFILATMHLGIDLKRAILAFIDFRNAPGGPNSILGDVSNFVYIFKSSVYVFQTTLGDGFVIYRLFIVWAGDYRIIIFPVLMLLGGVAAGIGACFSFSIAAASGSIFKITLGHWIVSYFSITIALNVLCTALIAWKIWSINHQSARAGDLNSVIVIIVESGAIYSATLLTLLILYELGNFGQYLVLDAVNPIIGITFTLIIIRVSLGLSVSSGRTGSSARVFTLAGGPSRGGSGTGTTGKMPSFGKPTMSSGGPEHSVDVTVRVDQESVYDKPYMGDSFSRSTNNV